MLEPTGVPISALIGKVSEQEIADKAQRILPREHRRPVPEDVRARTFLAERMREGLSALWGTDLRALPYADAGLSGAVATAGDSDTSPLASGIIV